MMSEEEILWHRPELLVPVPTEPKKKLEETIDKYLGEDDGQNLGDC
tara:strand:- start:758 stop:895 length:138 start_codon:yes stop_codon:yes gene_type:complete